MKLKKYLNFIRKKNKMNNIEKFNDHIEKIFEELGNDKIPIDIIKLCECYNWKPLLINAGDMFPGSFIITKDIAKRIQSIAKEGILKYDFCFLIKKSTPLEQRLDIALLFSALYMLNNELCDIDEFKNSIVLKGKKDKNSYIYKFAIMLLCPKYKIEEIIRLYNYTPSSLLESSDYQEFVNKFLISSYDFEKRLKLLIEEDI